MKRAAIGTLACLVSMGILACQPATKQDMDALREQQAEILKKLTALEEKVGPAQPTRRGPPPEDYDRVYDIAIGNAPVLGNPDAPITLVEYSDFECPFCAQAAPNVKALQAKYPDRLRVVYKHFPLPFHPAARPSALASLAAQDQGKFWEFHDVIFDATEKRELEASDEKLGEYAAKAGLDVERFKRDLAEKKAEYEKSIDADYAQGQRVQVRGTPTLYINGKKVRTRTLAAMSAMVDAALAEIDQS